MPAWLLQSCAAALLLTIPWVAMPFFAKNFSVSGAVFAVWYFAGTAIAIALFGAGGARALVPSFGSITIVFAIGLTAGGLANGLLFNAVAIAPNPGLPVAIANIAAVSTFAVAVLLGKFLPRYFESATFDMKVLIGIVLVVAGAGLIAAR